MAWRGATVGATTTVFMQLPTDATYGLIAFAGLGAAYAPVGIASALVCTALAQAVAAAAGSRYLVAGPRAGSALIVAALVVSLSHQPAFSSMGGLASPQGVALATALVALAVLMSGVMQLAVGMLGFGNLSRALPLPVRAGFLTGVGVLLILSGLVMVLGGTSVGAGSLWQALGRSLSSPSWPAMAVGLLACACTVTPPQRLQLKPGLRVPPALLGVVGGLLLHFAILAFWPGANMGHKLGTIGGAWEPAMLAWTGVQQLDLKLVVAVLPLLFSSAFALAVLAAVETSFAAAVVDARLRYRRDGNRESIAQGLSNIACGALGGQASSPVVGRSVVLLDSGGTWSGATLVYAAMVGAVVLAWPGALQWLPLSVVGGGLMGVGLLMLDRWTLRNLRMLLPSRRAALNSHESSALLETLWVTTGVAAAILLTGLVWGVMLGVVAAMVLLVRRNARGLVRSVQRGDTLRSKKVRQPKASAALDLGGHRLVLIELHGMLFFGNAAELTERVRAHSQGADWVLLSMQRVSDIDATGARSLLDLARELSVQNKMLIAADVPPEDKRLHHLKALGWPDAEGARLTLLTDTDQALQWAEDWILREGSPTRRGSSRLSLADTELAANMSAEQVAQMQGYMTQHQHDTGAVLFNVGDPGDALYVCLSGDIVIRLPPSVRRLASYAPGVMVGELALIDGSRRSEQGVAETPISVLRLDRRAFERMRVDHPVLWDAVMRNLTVHLAVRLRSVTTQLAAASER